MPEWGELIKIFGPVAAGLILLLIAGARVEPNWVFGSVHRATVALLQKAIDARDARIIELAKERDDRLLAQQQQYEARLRECHEEREEFLKLALKSVAVSERLVEKADTRGVR